MKTSPREKWARELFGFCSTRLTYSDGGSVTGDGWPVRAAAETQKIIAAGSILVSLSHMSKLATIL
jgi:hypothetical protein